MNATPALFVISGLLLGSPLFSSAQEVETPLPAPLAPVEEATPQLSPRENAIQQLFEVREEKLLSQAIIEARAQKIPEQTILEARFLYVVDKNALGELTSLIPELTEKTKTFELKNSQICSVKEEWLSIVEYAKALSALEKNDTTGFKKHITEAFWLSPQQAPAFAPHIEKLRLQVAMADLTLNLSLTFPATNNAEQITLLDPSLDKEIKAILIHAWSPWSRECQASMPDFVTTSALLKKNKIKVLSLLPEKTESARRDAQKAISALSPAASGQWITDTTEAQLAYTLRVQSLPTMILVDPQGKILFNGHPSDPELWEKLAKLCPDLHRPDTEQSAP